MNRSRGKIFSVLRLALVVGVIALLYGCLPEPEAPLRVGTNAWPGYEPLYLARGLGYYDDTRVHLVELPSASEVLQEFRSGNIEGAALTLDEALSIVEVGLKIEVLLVMDFSNGGDVLLAKPEYSTLKQLKGKRIGVETTAVGALMLDGALESGGLSVEDVEIYGCSVDEHVRCYQNLDAIVTFDPAKTQIENLGAVRLFDSSQLPGRIVDVLVIRKSAIGQSPNGIRQLLAGYFKAREYFEASPAQAAEIMAKRLKVSPEEMLDSFTGLELPSLSENRRLLGDSEGLEKVARDLATLMHQKGLLQNPIGTTGLANAFFLPSE